MIKKMIALVLSVVMVVTLLVGCGGSKGSTETKPTPTPAPAAAKIKVGMVTDSGTIDDKSFNQGTWEGVLKAGKEFGLETKYLKPTGTTEADYLKEIGNLYDAGYKVIICPGYKFESAIGKAQAKYPDAKFAILDGNPTTDGKADIKQNSVAIFFTEHESGFIAGLAASLQLKEGQLGFIGGMEIPAVQKFNWGFQQGVKYANDNLGTKMSIKAENVVYQGSFDNVAAGQQIAAQMFDKGVKAIFAAAGGVGVGAINEAKARAKAGKTAWIIGVDADQYADGIYEANKSIIITSAVKRVDQAAYDMAKAAFEGKFVGGKTILFDSKSNGVGIPATNPNLAADVTAKASEIFKKMQAGEIKVAAEKGTLIK